MSPIGDGKSLLQHLQEIGIAPKVGHQRTHKNGNCLYKVIQFIHPKMGVNHVEPYPLGDRSG